MRLVCPNCDARYEVPDDAIPDGGRDVQCSACGHAWFQLPPDLEAAAEEEAALFGDDLPAAEAGQAFAGDAGATIEAFDDSPAPPPPFVSDPITADPLVQAPIEEPQVDEEALTAAINAMVTDEEDITSAPAVPPRAKLDDEVRAVLRDEAERETEARRAEAQRAGSRKAEAEGQMQVQPELGVGPAPAALSPTQRRLAMLKGKDPDAPPPEPRPPARRSDLLPDVEEINSTLQPGDAAAMDAEVDALPDLTRGGGSFRNGFFLVILLLIIAAAVYVTAPQLAEQFPSMKPYLDSFVAFVDAMRLWLNDKMNSATAMLKGDAV